MGQLALTAAGGLFFGPYGAVAGSLLGGLLFPPKSPTQESFGPRRSDLRISSATRGRPIPQGFGAIVLPGEVIWSSGIREVATTTTTETGGKGGSGPVVRNTTYSYFVDFSAAFAQGPAQEILRLWLDNHLVYDNRDFNTTNASPQVVIKPGLTMRKYLGTEDQSVCPTMAAAEGAANTPAHRGTVYITLDNLDVTKYGRIPQIKAEIAFLAEKTDSGRLSAAATDDWDDVQSPFMMDWTRDLMYARDTLENPEPVGLQGMRVWRFSTLQEIRNQPVADMNFDGDVDWSPSLAISIGTGSGYFYMTASGSNQAPLIIIDPVTLTQIGRYGSKALLPGIGQHDGPDNIGLSSRWTETVVLAGPQSGLDAAEKRYVMGWSLITDAFVALDVSVPSNPLMVGWGGAGSGETAFLKGVTTEPPQIGSNRIWAMHHEGGNTTGYLKYYEIDYGASYDADNNTIIGFRRVDVTNFTSDLWGNASFAAADIAGPTYDQTDGNLIFGMRRADDSVLWKWNIAMGQIQWVMTTQRGVGIPYTGYGQEAWQYGARIRNGRLGLIGGSDYEVIDTTNGVTVDTGNPNDAFPAWRGQSAHHFWDDTYQVFTGEHAPNVLDEITVEQFFVGRSRGFGTSLQSVVNQLSGAGVNGAKLTPSQYDATDLADDTLRGGAITRPTTPRQYIESLGTAFEFDVTPIDGAVTFVKRGGASVVTITEDDLVDGDPLVGEQRVQEPELPRRMKVDFIDLDVDYEDNTAIAQRSALPISTMLSRDESGVELPFVFTMAEAKEIAERVLHTLWSQRVTFTFTLHSGFYQLVPTNVVTLQLNSGSAFTLRIIKTEASPDHRIEVTAVVRDAALELASGATADVSQGFEAQAINNSVATQLFFIDGPYLRDQDATLRLSAELKYAMAGMAPGWVSGTLYQSEDNTNYEATDRAASGVDRGVIINQLPTGRNPDVTDTATILQVAMVDGALSGISDADYYNNVNVAAVGDPNTGKWEYIIYRDAVQQSNGVWHVSYIGRGRRGTDAPEFTETHGRGETFLVLTRATVERLTLPLSKINATRYYKGVGDAEFVESAAIRAHTLKARALQPFRPVLLGASVDGSDNIDIAWTRSTRINYEGLEWGDKPLNEDSEAYEVDILDAPGGSVVRTIAVTSEAAEYTKAQITSDLGAGTATTIDVGSTTTFTRASGSFVTDGYLAGMTIETANFTDGANNGLFTVAVVEALTLTLVEATLVGETGTGDETIDAIREADVTFVAYQISAQAGRGFASTEATIAL